MKNRRPMPKLMSRKAFAEAVLTRDNGACVICGATAVDAHHILERRLFVDVGEEGGYFLDNGASLCATHHLACEATDISVETVRAAANITRKIVPAHLYDDAVLTKWGDEILGNGQRLRGELFEDTSVQRVIAQHLHEYTTKVRYPRTFHLPWSPGVGDDDRVLRDLTTLGEEEVIVSVKMDGENTSLYKTDLHARSLDSRHNVTRDWIKTRWAQLAQDIPEGWRIVVENMWARHSIAYSELPSYMIGLSVWNERNICLGWDETLEWMALLDIVPARTLYRGPFDIATLRRIENALDLDKDEGYVVRLARAFPYRAFRSSVGKWVRDGHQRTAKHWLAGQPVVRNRLKGEQP